jgi:parvulin-like peptidyl-prolyl isomerase
MRKSFITIFSAALLLFACGDSNESVTLEEGTEAYELASQLSEKVEYLNPDENNPLVEAGSFTVTTGEVIQTIQETAGNRTSQLMNMNAEQLESIIKNYAESLGQKKLLLNAADDAGVSIAETTVDSVLQIQYQRVGGEEQFMSRLEQSGVSVEAVRREVRENLKMDRYLNKTLMDEIQVTDDEIIDAYERDKTATVRHILFSTQQESDSARQETLELAKEVLDKAQSGADFASLAEEYTEDPGSKDTGGLYEDFERGEMVPPFEDAAFSIPVGEVGDELVETSFGYHIIKVIDRGQEEQPLEDVRMELENEIKQNKQNEVFQEHLEELKAEENFTVVDF